jgi:SAM-dependent methyltransferase
MRGKQKLPIWPNLLIEKMMVNYHFDEEYKFYRVRLGELEGFHLDRLIAFVRTVKQTEAKFLLIEFDKDLQAIPVQTMVKDRLEWSKKGQLLTNLIESLPFPVVSVVHGQCINEYLEIALSCNTIWVSEQASLDISYGDGEDFPRFGSLKRMAAQMGERIFAVMQEVGGVRMAWTTTISSRNQQTFVAEEGLKRLIAEYANRISQRSIVARRLLAYQHAKSPTEKSSLDYLETTIFANSIYLRLLENIKYLREQEFKGILEQFAEPGRLVFGLDDIGNDYMDFRYYPDRELKQLKRKSRLAEVEMLLEQSIAPINGKCIELGSGYGYFSALASKSPKVSEAVALDISAAEMYQLGPYMWEYLRPDWTKFSLRVADMNRLVSEYGSFDTVIFCASLHHSGDIPKSLEVAGSLLKSGGSLIIHGEHYDPVFWRPKKRGSSDKNPHTIPEFSTLMEKAGFVPKVYRYALPGKRFPRLKKWLFTKWPFSYLNGWFRFHSFMMLGIKR